MSETTLRKKLHEYIDQADHRLLKMIFAMMEAYENETSIVGYTVDGQPITQEGLKKRIEEAERQIENGDCISQEDLEKESSKW